MRERHFLGSRAVVHFRASVHVTNNRVRSYGVSTRVVRACNNVQRLHGRFHGGLLILIEGISFRRSRVMGAVFKDILRRQVCHNDRR